MSGRDDDVNVVIHVCVLKLNCYRNKCCSLLGIVIVMNITAKLLNNHCVLLGIIVCTTTTGMSSFHSCDLHHSACTHFGAK